MKIRTDINISFETVNTLLSFSRVSRGRTVFDMHQHLPTTISQDKAQYSIDYMIKRKILIRAKNNVKGGKSGPQCWQTNPAISHELLSKVA